MKLRKEVGKMKDFKKKIDSIESVEVSSRCRNCGSECKMSAADFVGVSEFASNEMRAPSECGSVQMDVDRNYAFINRSTETIGPCFMIGQGDGD